MATTQATKKTSPVNVEHRKKLDIRPGDTVRVYTKVVEKGKTRLQPFEGMVLARKHGSEPGATFTVRKVSSGVGIERIFPLYSPNIEKIELVKRAKTRRSKLYYIREKATKEIRRKMKAVTNEVPDTVSGEAMPDEQEESHNEDSEQPTNGGVQESGGVSDNNQGNAETQNSEGDTEGNNNTEEAKDGEESTEENKQ